MSAIHIPAEAGHTYLMTDGRRLVVYETSAYWIHYHDEGRSYCRAAGRSGFESHIESVLS